MDPYVLVVSLGIMTAGERIRGNFFFFTLILIIYLIDSRANWYFLDTKTKLNKILKYQCARFHMKC